jgi:hypothetical protein
MKNEVRAVNGFYHDKLGIFRAAAFFNAIAIYLIQYNSGELS